MMDRWVSKYKSKAGRSSALAKCCLAAAAALTILRAPGIDIMKCGRQEEILVHSEPVISSLSSALRILFIDSNGDNDLVIASMIEVGYPCLACESKLKFELY
jgi:hypothetical protein